MPLPIFHPVTFEYEDDCATDLYFNPSSNFTWDRTQERNEQNFMKLSEIITVCNLFLSKPEYIDDVLDFVSRQRTGSVLKLKEYKFLFSALPAEYKWMIFFIRLYDNFHPMTNTFQLTATINYPRQIYYNEWENGHHSFYFNTVWSDGEIINDPLNTDLQTVLAANISAVINFFTIHNDSRLLNRDVNLPSIICMAIAYANDWPMFYPTGARDQCLLEWDWARPSTIYHARMDGGNVTTSFSEPRRDRLNFKAVTQVGSRANLHRLLSYSSNVLEYLPYTIKGPKEGSNPTYGVELEACGNYTVPQVIDAQKDLFFIAKQDGSIFGNKTHCYELVTVPASLKAHKRLWAEWFEKIDYNEFDTSKNTGNGMHVHIDRRAFKNPHLNRFTWFITNPANFNFIHTISERPTKRNMEEWARMPAYNDRYSKLSQAKVALEANRGIRGAVHYKSSKTVEIRLFKGIVSYATIIKNLEFVDSVFFYTQETSLSQMNLKHYLAWLGKTPKNKYTMLKTFLSEVKIDDLSSTAEVTEYLWGVTQDHIVVDKLNKAPFKVTNSHITALNKKKRRRTFILKNGQVLCVSPSGGLLAKLDKTVQQRQTRGAASFTLTNISAA